MTYSHTAASATAAAGSFALGPWAAGLGYSALGVLALLAVTFVVSRLQHRNAVVDVAWGLGFVVVAAVSVAASAGHGQTSRRVLVLLLTGAWGLRLAAHIAWRSRGAGEDPRYAALMEKARGNPTWAALRSIYLTQGVSLWFISLPLQVACYERTRPGPVCWIGVAVWAIGLTFEAVGDWQLSRFRADPATKGTVLDTGLWHYTRHPNYFGDACVWWGLFLVAAGSWPGVLTVLSPLVMTFLLAKGTGKPLLEAGLSARRPGYAEYVRRTSGFVPWPPRRQA